MTDMPDFRRCPQSVVSLVPSMTESLFVLGVGERLIGRTDYCVHPPEAASVPALGGTKNPDIARIIALRPDLVIASQEENRREDVEALIEAGIAVWVTMPQTVADTLALLRDIVRLFQLDSALDQVQAIERVYEQLMQRQKPSVTVFAPIWLDPLMTFNAGTYCHDLLSVCGAANVFAHRQRMFPLKADLGQMQPYADDDPRVVGLDRRYPRVTLDELAAAQPELILLPDEPYPFGASHVQMFAELDVPAARSGRIHSIDGSYLTWPGTRLAYALVTLPNLTN